MWQFREPVATLLDGDKTIGRHYAGPHWELADGSRIAARVCGRAAGATPQDIPLLKLEVTSRRGTGLLADVTTIQRHRHQGRRGRRRMRPARPACRTQQITFLKKRRARAL